MAAPERLGKSSQLVSGDLSGVSGALVIPTRRVGRRGRGRRYLLHGGLESNSWLGLGSRLSVILRGIDGTERRLCWF